MRSVIQYCVSLALSTHYFRIRINCRILQAVLWEPFVKHIYANKTNRWIVERLIDINKIIYIKIDYKKHNYSNGMRIKMK